MVLNGACCVFVYVKGSPGRTGLRGSKGAHGKTVSKVSDCGF